MSKLSMTRRKFASVFVAFALAMPMCVAAPASALAAEQTVDEPIVFLAEADGDATTATITATGVVPTATVGSVTNLLADIDQYATVQANGTYHLDFAVTGGTKFATVNKHKGELTGVAAGTAKVTVYVVSGTVQSDPQTPCGGESLASVTLNIPVEAAGADEYGFQGNEQTIKVTSPTPTVVSGNNTDGWTNALGTVTPNADGKIGINFSMSSGIGQNTIAEYEAMNANYVSIVKNNGTVVATLADGDMSLAQQGTSKTDLTLYIDADALDLSGNYNLVFSSSFSAGNSNNPPLKTLGCSITFTFSV